MKRRASVVVSALLVAGCHLGTQHTPTDAAIAPAPSASSTADARVDAGLPPRCVLAKGTQADSPFGEQAELGEALPFGTGFVFGALRSGEAGRVAALVGAGTEAFHATDLGPSWGDAPAPQPFVHGDDLYAVAYVKTKGANTHDPALSVHHVGHAGSAFMLPAETDDSRAYDVATLPPPHAATLVTWDDLEASKPRGIIELALLSTDATSVAKVRVVKPAVADGELGEVDLADPRLTARGDGFWLTWVARRPEHPTAPLALPAGEIETPSEEASYSWVEAAKVDADGAVSGARPLTSVTGHVGSYAITTEGGALLVLAEDDGRAGTRGGGSLEQVVWRSATEAPEVTHVVRSGVDEDTPLVIVGATGDVWLSFVDVRGEAEMLPLSPARGAIRSAVPAVEPGIGGGRVVGGAADHLAVIRLENGAWSMRWLACLR